MILLFWMKYMYPIKKHLLQWAGILNLIFCALLHFSSSSIFYISEVYWNCWCLVVRGEKQCSGYEVFMVNCINNDQFTSPISYISVDNITSKVSVLIQRKPENPAPWPIFLPTWIYFNPIYIELRQIKLKLTILKYFDIQIT